MKKNLFNTLPILLIAIGALSGCHTDNRFSLTYGSYVDTSAKNITYEEFVAKLNHQENMIIATYDSELSPGCSCWTGFKSIIDSYVNKTHTLVYQIDRKEFEDKTQTFGITILASSDPTFIITKDGEIKTEMFKSKNNEHFFTKYDSFVSAVNKLVKAPKLMLVNKDYLDNALFSSNGSRFNQNQIVYFLRETCGDCNYCTPNVLVPYFTKNKTNNEILCMDIDYLRSDMDKYAALKTEYGLTKEGNATYGFDEGVVPTFQVYKSGQIVDACVYFNDSIAKDENDKWHIVNSYYTDERINNLKYTNTVLMGKELGEEEIKTNEQYNYSFWSQEFAAKEHNKILNSFLDYYVK